MQWVFFVSQQTIFHYDWMNRQHFLHVKLETIQPVVWFGQLKNVSNLSQRKLLSKQLFFAVRIENCVPDILCALFNFEGSIGIGKGSIEKTATTWPVGWLCDATILLLSVCIFVNLPHVTRRRINAEDINVFLPFLCATVS